ncbi:MAG: hypothetical protein WKG07_07150 [Hymenobacter sp.]
MLLDDNTINAYLNRNLKVEILNPSANTIQISFQDNNRLKAQRIVNALDTVYHDVKLAHKQDNDQQLAGLHGHRC